MIMHRMSPSLARPPGKSVGLNRSINTAEKPARFAPAARRCMAAWLSRQLGFVYRSIFEALAEKTAAEKPL